MIARRKFFRSLGTIAAAIAVTPAALKASPSGPRVEFPIEKRHHVIELWSEDCHTIRFQGDVVACFTESVRQEMKIICGFDPIAHIATPGGDLFAIAGRPGFSIETRQVLMTSKGPVS
jgi:hypothetical protein